MPKETHRCRRRLTDAEGDSAMPRETQRCRGRFNDTGVDSAAAESEVCRKMLAGQLATAEESSNDGILSASSCWGAPAGTGPAALTSGREGQSHVIVLR